MFKRLTLPAALVLSLTTSFALDDNEVVEDRLSRRMKSKGHEDDSTLWLEIQTTGDLTEGQFLSRDDSKSCTCECWQPTIDAIP